MKEFKSKRIKKSKKKNTRLRMIIFTFFFMFSYVFAVKYLRENQLRETILQEDVNYVKFDIKKEVVKASSNVVNNPVSLLNKNVKSASKSQTIKSENKKASTSLNNVSTVSEENNKEPYIYVYNTHQTEGYLDYSVYDAASYLSKKLNDNAFYSRFEKQSVKTFLDENNLKYYKSYTASRKYLEEAMGNNKALKYFFDIHRDSVSKKISTTSYNGKSYAKIMFVVGTDNPSSDKNNNNAVRLNEIVKSKVPTISRGVVKHGGKGYNGVYNQDLSENVFLIEVGGMDNTKEEVQNTINVIYESIIEYIRGVV